MTVVTGVDQQNFTVGAGDIGKFLVGATVMIHDTSYTFESAECLVTNVNTGTDTVTVGTLLGFTPSSGQFCELIGFADGGNSYRLF